MKKKDYLLLMTLAILPILLVLILVPTQSCFAHEVDWLSQHSTIPDYFRQLFYQSKDLFPDYAAHLQGGINIYALSYYGLFRPDVLISYLLPMVSMETIIITYMILMMSFASCLCFIWLKRKGYTSSLCMFVSILLICSSMFFQSHKQIMFVNYLPFLFMALLAIDKYLIKHKTIWLSIAIFLIILHSYFFSIAAIIICILYYFYMLSKQEKLSLHTFIKKDTLRFLYAIMLAILLAAILLLPTALVILENTKSVANTTLSDVLTMSLDLDGLLYDPYGCGLTMIAWISISLGLYSKQTRNLSILLIVSFVFPLIAYLLNGTLYARSKILIVYLPLVLLLICDVLQQLKHKQIKIKPSLLFLVIIPILFYTGNKLIMLSDAIFTLLILWIYQNKTKMHLLFGNLLYPLLCVALINSPSEFLTHESYVKATSKEKQTLIEQYQKQGKGRSDDLSSPLANSNRLYSLHEYKTTAYTSTYLSLYNTFYYDIMKNPISIVNRVAMLANNNIFFQGFMGVDTIYTNKKVPIGYEVKKQNKQIKIAENKNVLPLGYATSDLISDETFDQLTYPYTLDTLYNNAIVKQGDHHYQSQMKPVQLEYQVVKKTKQLEYETKENRVRIHAKQDSQLSLDINQDLTNQIILISFDVNDVEN
ncbi:MAG: hypothetical protein EOM11_05085, partial [Erysipelotrichia bacterium]|nr:hypothetical protein [Erysipelotrichia bacterium]